MSKPRSTKRTSKPRATISWDEDTERKAKALEAALKRTRSGLYADLVNWEFERRYGNRKAA